MKVRELLEEHFFAHVTPPMGSLGRSDVWCCPRKKCGFKTIFRGRSIATSVVLSVLSCLDVLHMFAVRLAQHDLLDSSPARSQQLFLDASHRKDLAAQGDFAGHGEVGFDFSAG